MLCIRAAIRLSIIFLLTSCAGWGGPSPDRIVCLDVCGKDKDRCVLEAEEATSVQKCDAEAESCGLTCPP
jgi:hypothetical protein